MKSQTQDADNAASRASLTDRAVLEGCRRNRCTESLRPLVERYGAFVYSSAYRRTGDTEAASEVTRAVFLVLARHAHRLRQVALAGWLFRVTAVACYRRISRLRRLWHWISRHARPSEPSEDGSLWRRVGPGIDRALDHLYSRQRNAVLLCAFLNHDFASAAKGLRTSERRVEKSFGCGMKKLAKRLHKRCGPVSPGDLFSACAMEGCSTTFPGALSVEIVQAIEERRGQRPSLKLAQRTLWWLAWARWRRRGIISATVLGVLLAIAGGAIWHGSPTSRTWLFGKSQMWGAWYWHLAMAEAARPWLTNAAAPQFDARLIRHAEQLYRTTNLWPVHLAFTREQWKALEPKRVGLLPDFILPDHRILLRNPEARRSGILGVLGYEYDWSHAQCEFGQVSFTNIAARVKGNIASLWQKRPYKLDLNKFEGGQTLVGLDELTFDNLVFDNSCMNEALAYEFSARQAFPPRAPPTRGFP